MIEIMIVIDHNNVINRFKNIKTTHQDLEAMVIFHSHSIEFLKSLQAYQSAAGLTGQMCILTPLALPSLPPPTKVAANDNQHYINIV